MFLKLRTFVYALTEKAQIDLDYLIKGGFWVSGQFIAGSLLAFISLLLFANLLPKDIYGTYRYILSVSGILMLFTVSGMDTAVTRAVSRGHDQLLPYSIEFQLRWNNLFFIASIITALYYIMHGNYTLAVSLLILGATFPLTLAFGSYAAFLLGKKDFKRIAIYDLWTNIINTVPLILIILFTQNILILIAVYSLSRLIPVAFFYIRTLKLYNLKKTDAYDQKEKKEMVNYAKHLSFLSAISVVSSNIDKVLIFHYIGAIQVAIYSFALAIPTRFSSYIRNLTGILMPRLSAKTSEAINSIFYKRLAQTFILGTIFSVVYIITAPLVFRFLLPNYLESIRYSQAIALLFIFSIPNSYIGTIFKAQKVISGAYAGAVLDILRIILYIIFAIYWGIWGIIIATILVQAISIPFNILIWEWDSRRIANLEI